MLERILRESRAVDTEALCIVAEDKVWSIRCDIHVIDHGGNLLDCASIAAICALHHFRRPEVTIDGDTVTIHSIKEKEPVPLSIHHTPICVTFGLFEQINRIVVDPTVKEEVVMDGKITFAVNEFSELCAIQKIGGVASGLDIILNCTQISALKAAEIVAIIKTELQKIQQPLAFAQSVIRKTNIKQNLGSSTTTQLSIDTVEKKQTEDEPLITTNINNLLNPKSKKIDNKRIKSEMNNNNHNNNTQIPTSKPAKRVK
eukprot:TRINITY_DN2091_c2_g1_i2.p1 TRINITY_DN2091_c2_g1~~TRINITY_DN2091_c2_g1_i2.p1  ORF type:complete len:258 (+),score=126.58 TRINITY_DN2091_c2_g1_i2:543-1316(+)